MKKQYKIFTPFTLSICAIAGLFLGIYFIYLSTRSPPVPPIAFPPPQSPYPHSVAGAGVVEAASEDIEIGTPFSEIVEIVYVAAGQSVKKDDPLFKLISISLEKQLEESIANYAVAKAQYQKQLALPRPEEVPPVKARVKEAEANYKDMQTRYELVDKVSDPSAVSRDEYYQKKYGALIGLYQLEEAQEKLNLLLAGAWVKDLEISLAEVKAAETKIDFIKTEIERSTIRAPFTGTVLRVNIHEGEFAHASNLEIPLMLFGVIDPLHIRVDIDEADAWRVLKNAPGVAFVRGNSSIKVPLKYIRLEPFLVPKLSLTGENQEKVDTRVLQVIYSFERNSLPIYPGQIMDVFLEAKPHRHIP